MTENTAQAAFVNPRSHYRIWLLRLMLPIDGPIGRILSAALILSLTWVCLGLMKGRLGFYEQLFFTAMIAYSIVIFARIIGQSEQAIDDLQMYTDLPAEQLASIRTYMSHNSRKELFYTLAGALFFGCAHILLIRISSGSSLNDILFNSSVYSTHLGTLVTWIILTTVISSLINNAIVWARLGNTLEIDLLRPKASCIIGRVAVLSTLSIIGAQVLFGILMMDSTSDWVSIVPGLAASFVPSLALFFIPVWPLHKRLRASKAASLDDIDNSIQALGNLSGLALTNVESVEQLNRLLLLRREVQLVSIWPYDTSNMFRFMLYLLLPPLTWVGAALVENMVGVFVE
jgi:hypothetical protein